MNKRKIFLGAFVLAVAGYFAGHASSKFAAAKAYYKTANLGCKAIDNATAAAGTTFTTSGTTQAQIRTNGGSNTLLYSNSSCTNAAYFLF